MGGELSKATDASNSQELVVQSLQARLKDMETKDSVKTREINVLVSENRAQCAKIVALSLLLKQALTYLENAEDMGVPDEGWQSDELKVLLAEVRAL